MWSNILCCMPLFLISGRRKFSRVQIISTDTYPLNENIFNYFSTSLRLKIKIASSIRCECNNSLHLNLSMFQNISESNAICWRPYVDIVKFLDVGICPITLFYASICPISTFQINFEVRINADIC